MVFNDVPSNCFSYLHVFVTEFFFSFFFLNETICVCKFGFFLAFTNDCSFFVQEGELVFVKPTRKMSRYVHFAFVHDCNWMACTLVFRVKLLVQRIISLSCKLEC